MPPGHGGSAAVRADLGAAAALLGATAGEATYVGYSMGGRLCLHLALARPDLVERLVLVSTTAGIEDPDDRAARRAADERLATSLEHDGLDAFLHRWVAQPLFATLPDPGLEDRRRNDVAGLASSLRLAGTGTQEPLWDRLPALTMPVLVVAGALDATFVAAAERMAALIPGATLGDRRRRRPRRAPRAPRGLPRHLSRWAAPNLLGRRCTASEARRAGQVAGRVRR